MLIDDIQTYLDWKATYAPRAAISYRIYLERLDEYLKKDLEDISISDIARYQKLIESKYAPKNVTYATVIVKNFFEFYVKQGRKVFDPWLIKIPKFAQRPHNYLTKEEFEVLDKVFDERDFWDLEKKVICRLLWDTGIRISELCALNVLDVKTPTPMAVIETKKNKQLGWCMWSKETHQMLLRYLGVRICLNQETPLFISKERKRRIRVTERTVQRWVKQSLHKAGITRKLSCHSFRHGKAHEILRKGGNVVHVNKVLRHQAPESSFAYLNLDPKESEKIMSRFL